MPMTLPPALAELEKRLGIAVGSLTGEEKARAEAALADASALALAEAPASLVSTWEAAAPAVVALVVLKAARREFDNPRGLATESLGEHSVGLAETSGVYLTAREIAQVRRAATGRRGGYVGSTRILSPFGES